MLVLMYEILKQFCYSCDNRSPAAVTEIDYLLAPCWLRTSVSQGARFLKIDLAQLSSQKRFDLRNS